MKIVLRTSTSDPSGDFSADCECAVLDVTPSLVDMIRRRAEIARVAHERDANLYELYFWGWYHAEFYDYDVISVCEDRSEEFTGKYENAGFALLPEAVELNDHTPQPTECNQMILRIDQHPSDSPEIEVAWVTIPKHTDVHITTNSVPLRTLESLIEVETVNEPS